MSKMVQLGTDPFCTVLEIDYAVAQDAGELGAGLEELLVVALELHQLVW